MTPIRLVLADDHALVRAGIRSLLTAITGVEVVAEAGDGYEVVQLVDSLQPRLVLMDISMPGLNGLEATARIVKSHPRTAVIILSMHATEEYALQALRAGASGYLLKDLAPAELELAIAAVARGETYLSPACPGI
jgi:DNA-binding NarL/FixJ family response regulator